MSFNTVAHSYNSNDNNLIYEMELIRRPHTWRYTKISVTMAPALDFALEQCRAFPIWAVYVNGRRAPSVASQSNETRGLDDDLSAASTLLGSRSV